MDLVTGALLSSWSFYRFREQADSGLEDSTDVYLLFSLAAAVITLIATGISWLLQYCYKLVPSFLYFLFTASFLLGFGYRGLMQSEWANGKAYGGTFFEGGEVQSALTLAVFYMVALLACVLFARAVAYTGKLLLNRGRLSRFGPGT